MSHTARISFFLITFAFLSGPPVQAQERPRMTASFTKAAHLSLLAIESDTSGPNDDDNGTADPTAMQKINAAGEAAVTPEEKSITEMLRRIYQLKRQDNRLLTAYSKLTETETAEIATERDEEEAADKDYTVSQFADAEAAVKKREEKCFRQLEAALIQRSSEEITACTEWIRRSTGSR